MIEDPNAQVHTPAQGRTGSASTPPGSRQSEIQDHRWIPCLQRAGVRAEVAVRMEAELRAQRLRELDTIQWLQSQATQKAR
jgi:hypothetical protein